jgi:ribosomal protein S18 acetylase RimI-like enzyme
MKFIELQRLADKRKWQEKFVRSYKLGLTPLSDEIFGENVKFFVAKKNGKELGFVRINNKSKFFGSDLGFDIWNLTDAYVKPQYRNKGVLKEMLQFVIANQSVKMCCLDPQVFKQNSKYYWNFGFTKVVNGNRSGLTWLLHKDIADLVN